MPHRRYSQAPFWFALGGFELGHLFKTVGDLRRACPAAFLCDSQLSHSVQLFVKTMTGKTITLGPAAPNRRA